MRQALDTVGAIGGPLLALAAMAIFASNFQAAFWIAVVPAVLCVILIVVGVDEPEKKAGDATPAAPFALRRRPAVASPEFWFIVAIAGVLTLARFSEAFLVLRAQNVGFAVAHAPLVMVVMAIVYAITAYPAGAALDRGRGAPLLAGGLVALIAADLVLALASAAVGLAGARGDAMGLTQGCLPRSWPALRRRISRRRVRRLTRAASRRCRRTRQRRMTSTKPLIRSPRRVAGDRSWWGTIG